MREVENFEVLRALHRDDEIDAVKDMIRALVTSRLSAMALKCDYEDDPGFPELVEFQLAPLVKEDVTLDQHLGAVLEALCNSERLRSRLVGVDLPNNVVPFEDDAA